MTSLLSDCRGPAWLLVIPLVLAVYPFSFNTFPIIENEHSVLGDAANYFRLIREFDLPGDLPPAAVPVVKREPRSCRIRKGRT